MQVAGRARIKSPVGATWRLHVIGDVHLYDAGCAEDAFRARIEQIAADPRALWIGIGDYIDAIGLRDPRFDPTRPRGLALKDFADLGRVTLGGMLDILRPIRGKCIGVGYGNHEDVLLARTDSRGLWRWFVEELGTRDLGFSAMIDLCFEIGRRECVFRIATHHGAGWACTAGGKLNRLRTFMEAFIADLVLTGHTHEQLDHRASGLAANAACDRLVSVQRLGVVCGTWLRTYTEGTSGYGEQRGYRPVALGNPAITIQPESRRFGVEW